MHLIFLCALCMNSFRDKKSREAFIKLHMQWGATVHSIIRSIFYMKKDPFTDTASYNPVRLNGPKNIVLIFLLFLRLFKNHQAKDRCNASRDFFYSSTSKIFHAPLTRQEDQVSKIHLLSWCFLHNPINMVQSVVIMSCNSIIIQYTKNQFLRFKFSKLT